MGTDARRLADDCHVEMPKEADARAHQLDGMAEEVRRLRSPPARVGGREMLPYIARADRAEHRVGEGMQPDIGIGMADQTLAVRHADAAQHHMVARPEPV